MVFCKEMEPGINDKNYGKTLGEALIEAQEDEANDVSLRVRYGYLFSVFRI